MKRLTIALTVMALGVYLMLQEAGKKQKKESRYTPDLTRKKIKKSHFPGKEMSHAD
ncbi:MAG TPA: hypothetical protein VN726_13550 [Hanamia sp.]|nr:hypothetical protein [Hanamia sp.]